MRSDLPSGTVTFLFTDVEGSTKLLHELGAEAYAEALAEHHRVIREACAAEDGVEVDTQGDAFFFAFPTAPGALVAAEAMTEALAAGPIQVRIGLHTGTPLLTGEGYVGDDVHFAARVAATSHGGQVVLSKATGELIELELTDLGEHRLKDISEAVPIFQLGNGSFPPLKTISNTNLPTPASSFVGRDDELLEVLSRIEDGARLVTLTGPGGTGKTRLAIEAASELVPEYKAGVFWVGLATLRDPTLVTETISQVIGAKAGLVEHIGERELLLLLDNLEQVIECAPELASLLEASPNLTLLVTSRELLRIQGEVEYGVPPLAESEAVALFCARSGLGPSDEIAELCHRLDDMPLAVELAAARTKALTPEQILDRLGQRLDLFRGGRDSDPRQQTLRATIEWSYELLTLEEQQLFSRLSVFSGGCTLEAAEEVADADLDTLQSLVEKSLLRFTDGRYWMLETIREFAMAVLTASGSLVDVRNRHADFVLGLTSRIETAAGARVEHTGFLFEQDNFREALAWTEHIGRTDAQLDLVGGSWPFWWYRGHPAEGLRWVDAALAASDGERTIRRAKVLAAGAMFAYRLGDLDTLKRRATESLDVAVELDVKYHTIWPLILLGIWAGEIGDYTEARRLYDEALSAASDTGSRALAGVVTNNLGVVATMQGDVDGAILYAEEALDLARELGTPDETALYTVNLAGSLFEAGRMNEAWDVARHALELARDSENVTAIGGVFSLLGALAVKRGEPIAGARLLGAAEALRARAGEGPQRVEVEQLERAVTELIEALGDDAYTRAFAEGRQMPLDEAIAFALGNADA